jgi:60 kDa SS-A/Ro ribonucleoprotein
MSALNKRTAPIMTHEGAVAKHINAELQLRRTIMACLLWENNFYEDGKDVAQRIAELAEKVDPLVCSKIAAEAREKMGLRHAPLWLLRAMARLPNHKRYVGRTLARVCSRPDMLTEFLAMYWKDGRQTLSAKVKQGLAHAFTRFNEYELAKYNRDGAIKLRDVLFLVHAKPLNPEQGELWKRLVDNTLAVPQTWEVGLSAAKNAEEKKAVWDQLLNDHKLGALAFVRNLRNMTEVGVDQAMIVNYGQNHVNVEKIYPWQFVAAAVTNPQQEPLLEAMMLKSLAKMREVKPLKGKTVLLVDNSGSMDSVMSGKGTMKFNDAACGIAMLIRELMEDGLIATFANSVTQLPPRRGFALRDAIKQSPSGGTELGKAINHIHAKLQGKYDRIIVITDEQTADRVPDPQGRGYMINVNTNKNGVGYGAWTHIDGFSSSVIEYIQQYENQF